jgi:hypothetical protein
MKPLPLASLDKPGEKTGTKKCPKREAKGERYMQKKLYRSAVSPPSKKGTG